MPVDCRLALSFGDYGGEHGQESEEGEESKEDSKKEKEVTVRPDQRRLLAFSKAYCFGRIPERPPPGGLSFWRPYTENPY
jgi:hypothetical protein